MRRLSITALFITALLAASCAGNDTRASDGALRFQVAGEAEEMAVYRTLVAAFEKEHPDIDVQLIEVANKDDHLQKLVTSSAVGDAPDVFLVNFREYSQFVVRGAIQPFEQHLGAAGIDLARYFEQPIEAFTFQGELQCMPQNVSSLVVYYNRDLFKQAGLERPERWDWAEFRGYAAALTGGDVRGVGIEPSIIRLAPFVWSNGGDIVDDLAAPTRFTLDEPRARAALEYLVSLARDELIPTEEEVTALDLETRFTTGKLGMLLSSRKDTPVFREAQDLDWDVLPLPVADQPAGILHSDAYCLSAGSELSAEAATFVGYAIGEEGATITALGGRTVPSLEEVARSGAFLNPIERPRHARVFLDAVPFLRRTPVLPTWPEIEDVAEEILTRAFYEPGYTIDDAISDLDAQTRPLFEEGAAP